MKSYAAFLVLRFIAALFFVLTGLYAVAAFSPFVFEHFIKPRVVAQINQFVAYHHLLYLAAYLLIAITLIPDVRRPRTRRLAIAYLVVFGIVGEWLVLHPWLPKLWNGVECGITAMAAFVPLVSLAIIDHVAAYDSVPGTVPDTVSDPRPRLVACLAAADYVAVLFLMRSVARGITSLTSGAILWAACWTLLLHAVGFVGVFTVLTAANTVASTTQRPRVWEYVALVASLAAAISAVILTIALPTISLSEAWVLPIAATAGCALAITWSGWALRRPRETGRPLDIITRPIAPQGRIPTAILLILLPAIAFPVLNRVEQFDWNALGQRLMVLAFWAIAFAQFVTLTATRDDTAASDRSIRAVLGPPLVAIGLAFVFAIVSARLHRWTTDPWLHHGAGLERYAASDTSFRILYDSLIAHRGDDPEFARFLQTNTNIPHWAVPRKLPDVTLAAGTEPPTHRPPHVFLFIIDSLRRDYVSAYNPHVTFTPRLGAFARESLVFNNAFTRYGGTAMALPSMWAGGLLVHSAFHPEFRPVNSVEKLIDRVAYRPLFALDHVMGPILTRNTALLEVNAGLPTMKFDMCNTMANMQAQIDRVNPDQQPLFGYALIETLHISLVFNRPVPDGESYPGYYGRVASELHRIDGCFGGFIDYLKRTRLYDDSVIVVTADHGDSLGENGSWGHGVRMAPEVVRVPLIVHVPDRLRPHVVADLGAVATLTDIAPTLYELAGFETRDAGPLFGAPLVATSDHRLDRERRRRSFLLAASYAATYGMLRDNGRLLYVADAVNGREYQFDLAEGLLGRQIDVTEDDRRLNHDLIRQQVTQLDEFYHYAPRAYHAPPGVR